MSWLPKQYWNRKTKDVYKVNLLSFGVIFLWLACGILGLKFEQNFSITNVKTVLIKGNAVLYQIWRVNRTPLCWWINRAQVKDGGIPLHQSKWSGLYHSSLCWSDKRTTERCKCLKPFCVLLCLDQGQRGPAAHNNPLIRCSY